MQKKIIALAVAGLMSGAAFAQSNVQIYGRVNMGVDTYKATGSVAGAAGDYKNRSRLFDQGSRLGFRGTEDLGNGMKAGFVMEAGVNMDQGGGNGQSGAANASTGSLASRSSWLSLSGGFGEVRAGRQDVYWGDGTLNQFNANFINMSTPFTAGSHGMVNGPTARTSNALLYITPNFSGLTAAVGYVFAAETAAVNTETNAKGVTVRVNYSNGPITALFDNTVVTAQDLAAVTGVAKNTGTKLGAGYSYAPGSQFAVIWNRHKNDNISAATSALHAGFSGGGDDLKQTGVTLVWEHTMGNTQLLGQYGRTGSVSGNTGAVTGDTKSKAWMLGARYNISKRTSFYGTYNNLKNGDMAWADYSAAGYSAAAGGALASGNRGADIKMMAVGMMHNF